jgi:UDP-arabinose 4-epimerase
VADLAKYYRNDVSGTVTLLGAMRASGLDKLVFSSSCATYGVPERLPISEDTLQAPISPYGRTKLMVEHILADIGRACGLRSVALRCFNAAGADPDGEIGERHDPEAHLIPRALLAAAGLSPALEVFGDDYPTADGSCVRDYVHVTDLAEGNVRACQPGRGRGERQHEPGDRARHVHPAAALCHRPGDQTEGTGDHATPARGHPPAIWADASRAKTLLGFSPAHSDTDTSIRTAWACLIHKPPCAGGPGPTPAQ